MMRLWHWGVRCMTTSVDKSVLSKLRKKTGFPFINCKKALEQFNNDIKQVWFQDKCTALVLFKFNTITVRPWCCSNLIL